MKRKILIGILILIVVGGSVVVWKFKEKEDNYAAKKPDIKTSAMALIEAFNKDTVAAVKMYVNKVIEVTGIITKIDTSAVELGEQGNPSSVVVGIDNRHLEDIRNLKTGTTVKLQGLCSGYQKASGDPDDMLSLLGTTVNIKGGGVIEN
jgi:hypothetical protein